MAELEALIAQIGELEQGNRREQQKLLEETLRHKSTTAELERANVAIEQLKAKVVSIEELVHKNEVQRSGDQKSIEELQTLVKNFQRETALLEDKLEKEKQTCLKKTTEFLEFMDEYNGKLREIHRFYQEKEMAKELEKTKKKLCDVEEKFANMEACNYPAEIESLKKQIEDAVRAKEVAQPMEVQQPMAVDPKPDELQALRSQLDAASKRIEELVLEKKDMEAGFRRDADLIMSQQNESQNEIRNVAKAMCSKCAPLLAPLLTSEQEEGTAAQA